MFRSNASASVCMLTYSFLNMSAVFIGVNWVVEALEAQIDGVDEGHLASSRFALLPLH